MRVTADDYRRVDTGEDRQEHLLRRALGEDLGLVTRCRVAEQDVPDPVDFERRCQRPAREHVLIPTNLLCGPTKHLSQLFRERRS